MVRFLITTAFYEAAAIRRSNLLQDRAYASGT